MTNTTERRVVTLTACEMRDAGDGGMHFEGYASVFNSPTMIGSQFREQVAPGAFDQAISDGQDVRMLFNHDANMILGRTGKNVTLSSTDRGLKVEADLPNTSLGRDMAELVRSGIVTQMSFGFSVPKDGDVWTRGADGIAERTLTNVRLFDVSPVVYPAYNDTTAEVRAQADELRDSPVGLAMADGTVDADQLAALKVMIDSMQTTLEGMDALLGEYDPELDPDTTGDSEDVGMNAARESIETRVSKVLSDENMGHLTAAMERLQALMANATQAGASSDAPDTEGGSEYNSQRRVIELLARGAVL